MTLTDPGPQLDARWVRTARQQLAREADAIARPVEVRPVALLVACPCCGRQHRVDAAAIGTTIEPPCRAGRLVVVLQIPDAPTTEGRKRKPRNRRRTPAG